ncbi:unnamed protein product, partial [Symbiodinium pilosum]
GHLAVFHDADDAQEDAQDAVGENAYTLTVANDVSAIIPALDMSNPKCIVVKEITGALQQWNDDTDQTQVQVFDRLAQVNGEACTSTVLRHMMDNASVDQLTFVVRRPTERVVVLPKSDRLGLDISFRKQVSIRPWVTGIRGGAMGQWNFEKPSLQIDVHDRILSVNGVSGGPLELVDKLQRVQDNLLITFLHYGDEVNP